MKMTFTLFVFFCFQICLKSQENQLIINFENGTIKEFNLDSVDLIKNYDSFIEIEDINFENSIILLKVGESQNVKYSVLPENASEKDLVWSSLNPEICSVDANGKVTGLAKGQAKILGKSHTSEIFESLSCLVVSTTDVKLVDNQIKIFPNPTSDFINIDLIENKDFEVSISDLESKIIYNGKNINKINISEYKVGAYILKLKIENSIYYFKILKN